MSISQILIDSHQSGKLNTRTLYAMMAFVERWKDLSPSDVESFFNFWDYYDIYFITGIGKKGFSQLQAIFPKLEKPYKIDKTNQLYK